MSFELAQRIADTVLYEGYVLYPYRASAAKNQVRWQFGVLAPRGYAEGGGGERWANRTECLVEHGDEARLDLRLRFLQVQARTIEARVDDWFEFLSAYHEAVLGWVGGSAKVDGAAPSETGVRDRLALIRHAMETLFGGRSAFRCCWTYINAVRPAASAARA